MTPFNNSSQSYPNPFFDYLSKMMPTSIKSMFHWLEYLYANSGQVYPVIKKFSEYAITDIVYDSESPKTKTRAKELFDTHLRMKFVLINISNDFHLYGNSFVSIYRPFVRNLKCKGCRKTYNVEKVDYEWDPKNFKYLLKCPSCGHRGNAEVQNLTLRDKTRLQVIRWDPKQIEIEFNPTNGQSRYYYDFPASLKKELKKKKPSPFILNTMPWEYVQAMRQKKMFRFKHDKIYHLKNPSPAGVSQEWGFPGLLCALKPYFYTAILKKANEAIALERLNPWRILFPQGNGASTDPAMMMNMGKWKNELEVAVKRWRKDPNSIKTSPIPVGVQEVGGNGRALLLHQEIKLEEDNTVTAMGVPLEFHKGGLSNSGGSVTLRMLENVLFTYTDQLERMLQWLANEMSTFMNYPKVEVSLIPFKLVDDVQQKQLIIQLWEAGKVSDTTASEFFDLDFEKERKRILKDSKDTAVLENSVQSSLQEMQSSISAQIKQEMSGNPLNYDPQAVMQVAQEQAQQLAQMPAESRKQQMEQMEQQDPVLHALVQKVLKSIFASQQSDGMGTGTPGGQQSGNGPSVGSPQNSL